MHVLLAPLVYYVAGSFIAGSVMGVGFATNIGRRPDQRQIESLQRIGIYIPLALDDIDGGLIAKANERRPTVVYVHGRSANRGQMAPLAKLLFDAGFNAVLWDSRSRAITYGPKEIDQVRRIIAAIRGDPHVAPSEIYVAGFSLGAAIAIGAASQDSDRHIRAIVADSAYADLRKAASRYITAFGAIPTPIAWPARTVTFATVRGLHDIDFDNANPADWAEKIEIPVFLIHGKSDKTIPYTHSEEIFDRLGTNTKELWLVEGAGHTKVFARSPAEYARRVRSFIERSRTR